MLGDRDINKVLMFRREHRSDMLLLDQPQWAWAWGTALGEVAGPDVYQSAVRMDRYLTNIQTRLHARLYRTGQTQRTCDHESIRAGAIVSFGGSLVRPDPGEPQAVQRKRLPEPQEVYAALERIGDTLGISPFGSKFGYGRFNIETLEINGRACAPPVGREHPHGDTGLQGDPAGAQDGGVGNGPESINVPVAEEDSH
jgi:hypothetical protein